MSRVTAFCVALATAMILAVPAAHAQVVLVARNGTFPDGIGADQIRAILLGDTPSVGKTHVTLMLTRTDNPDQERFFQSVLKIDSSRFRTHWIRMVFRGEARPPLELADPETLAERVAETPGALGLLPAEVARRHPELTTIFAP